MFACHLKLQVSLNGSRTYCTKVNNVLGICREGWTRTTTKLMMILTYVRTGRFTLHNNASPRIFICAESLPPVSPSNFDGLCREGGEMLMTSVKLITNVDFVLDDTDFIASEKTTQRF